MALSVRFLIFQDSGCHGFEFCFVVCVDFLNLSLRQSEVGSLSNLGVVIVACHAVVLAEDVRKQYL